MFLQTLCSSSAGNSVLVAGKTSEILIDCGMSAKKLLSCLLSLGRDAKNLKGIVITHEHIDHIRGLAQLSKRLGVKVYAHKGTARALSSECGVGEIETFSEGEDFYIEEFKLQAFLLPHDTPVCAGYRITAEDEQKTLGFAADLGSVPETARRALAGCDAVYIESNHDLPMLMAGRYPYFLKKRISGSGGHLSNDAAAALCAELLKSGTKTFVLGHLSEQNNLECLAFETTNAALFPLRSSYELFVSPKREPGERIFI